MGLFRRLEFEPYTLLIKPMYTRLVDAWEDKSSETGLKSDIEERYLSCLKRQVLVRNSAIPISSKRFTVTQRKSVEKMAQSHK